VIVEDAAREEAPRAIQGDELAEASIVRIDGPGGTVEGGESLEKYLRAIAERIPVVAVVGTVAASGGRMIALGADHIPASGRPSAGSRRHGGSRAACPSTQSRLRTVARSGAS
jgi:protease-4